MSDALVVFTPSGRRGRFPLGTPVLEAARTLGVYVESVCGGRGICGRCQVTPTFGAFAKHAITSASAHLSEINAVEMRYGEKRALPADRRLSCQTRLNGDMLIDIPTDTAVHHQVVRKRAEARDIVADPAVRLLTVQLPDAELERPIGALDQVRAAVEAMAGLRITGVDAEVVATLQSCAHAGNGEVTVALYCDAPAVENAAPTADLIAVYPGRGRRLLGLACDIGSTTIACHIVDLASGHTLASSGASNPQIRFGEDLMSRVSYVMLHPEGRDALTTCVRDAVGTLAEQVAAQVGARAAEILDATIVGNPVMHHLFLGIDPTPLGQAPFALAASGALTLRARDLGLSLHAGARVHMLPCIAGHVGADAAAVALAELPRTGDETALIVDVGTNAEIILSKGARVLAASSPTGPAFEGAQISAGQRAAPGAIERVRIDPLTLEPRIKVIGSDLWSSEPGFAEATAVIGVTGICGSGIIEAIGEMFLAGLITSAGMVDGSLAARTDRIVAEGRTFSYRLWTGAQDLRISQTDVRAIQLAKGALYAGVRLLMERLGVGEVDSIKLAGAFGTHIDPAYALIIGLVPDCDLARVTAVGNAAGTGARMALLNRGHRREVAQLVRRIEKIETALEPRFQALFVDAMAFPNARDPFPRLAEVVKLPARTGDPDATPRRVRRPRA